MAQREADDARWAAALRLVRGERDDAVVRRFRQRRSGMVWMAVGILVASAVAGVALWLLLRGAPALVRGTPPGPGRRTAGLILIGVGVAAEIWLIVRRFRSGRYGSHWRAPTLVLGVRQRRLLARQIRGRLPVDPELLPLTRNEAARIAAQRPILGMWLAVPLILLGSAVQNGSVIGWILFAVLTVGFAVTAVPVLADAGRAEQFLTRYPEAEVAAVPVPDRGRAAAESGVTLRVVTGPVGPARGRAGQGSFPPDGPGAGGGGEEWRQRAE